MQPNSPQKFDWVRIFNELQCCKYHSHDIPIGKSFRASNFFNNNDPYVRDFQCSENIVSCNSAEYDQAMPSIIINEVINSKCCNYENTIIPVGRRYLDAEVSLNLIFVSLQTFFYT